MLDRQKAALTAGVPVPAARPAEPAPAVDSWSTAASTTSTTDTASSDNEWETELNWTPLSWESSAAPTSPAVTRPAAATPPRPVEPDEPPVVTVPLKVSRWDWLRSAGPILIVNAVSAWGQASYAHDHLVPDSSPFWVRWTVGAIAALAAESVALYVNWHAHDALIRKDNRTAGRLRRSAYGIAAIVASVNYIQFSDHGAPTPLAVVIAMFTVLSPWLWGLHTRRRQHMQLAAEGVRSDSAGAVFSAIRRFYFPFTTIKATRWSVDHGVTDPMKAWEGYRAYRIELDDKKAARAERELYGPPPEPEPQPEPEPEPPAEPVVEAPPAVTVPATPPARPSRRQWPVAARPRTRSTVKARVRRRAIRQPKPLY